MGDIGNRTSSTVQASAVPGFGAIGTGRAVVLLESVSRMDVPVLIAEGPALPGTGLAGATVDYRLQMAQIAGMASTLDLRGGPVLAGWSARRRAAQRVEISAGSEVFITTKGYLPPRWIELAAELGEIVVVYGVGVLTSGQAPDRSAFTAGRAVAARLQWTGEVGQKPGYHLLDLRPAGLTLPVFSFPADELRARGQLENWGFEHLGRRDPAQPLPMSHRLVVGLHAGPGDVDVFDVGEAGVDQFRTELVPVVGLKGTTRPEWTDTLAAQYGRYLLLATTMSASTTQPGDLLLSSWCVTARVLAAPTPPARWT